jgi:SagB-type dehydrogenase family enzyme
MSRAGPGSYRRSPHLLLVWRETQAVLMHADTLALHAADAQLVELLAVLDDWRSADELRAAGWPVSTEVLEKMADRRILLRSGDDRPGTAAQTLWSPWELAVQRRIGLVGGLKEPGPPSEDYHATSKEVRGGQAIAGTDAACQGARRVKLGPPLPLGVGLQEALESRRTGRSYAARPLLLAELSALLGHAARVSYSPRGHPLRPFASAGARAELQIVVVVNDVEGVRRGAYRYHADDHALDLLAVPGAGQDRVTMSVRAATGHVLNRDPPLIVLITALHARMAVKYGDLALSLIYQDCGCLIQTLYLVGAALGLAMCAIGTGDDEALRDWLRLDTLAECQVGCVAVGAREAGS